MFMTLKSQTWLAWLGVVALVSVAGPIVGCGGSAPKAPAAQTPAPADAPSPAATPAGPADDALPVPAFEDGLPEGVRKVLSKPFTGDFDEMVKRRVIRVGVTFNRTLLLHRQGRAARRGRTSTGSCSRTS